MRHLLLCILLLTPNLWAANASLLKQTPANTIAPAEEAFKVHLGEVSAKNITLEFSIAPGTYLYEKEFKFTADKASFDKPSFPEGKIYHDPYFGEVTVFQHNVTVNLPIKSVESNPFPLSVSFQGCNDVGFCYPPQEATLQIKLPSTTPLNPTERAVHILQDAPMGLALLAFFGFGLLLAFTPCVLPMVPILSSLIIGEQHKHHRGHALRLALTYVLAMASTYAVLGAIVASLGARVQAQLQHPAMLSFTAVILLIMAVLLFNDKALSYASRINGPLHRISHKMHAGKTLGVIAMGVLSTLIISPCVTPPLIGALTYISVTGDVMLGAGALFLLALGMGVPLLVVAWGGTALLPNRGPWLNYVKHAFAVILVLMAFSLIARFAAPTWDWRHPLASLPSSHAVRHHSALTFTLIDSQEALDKALAQAKKEGKPVMLDFYADWCTTCITLEEYVFTDSTLSSELAQLVLLKIDVTHYNEATKALMASWNVYGPPALIFFDSQGNVYAPARVDGLVEAHELSQRLQAILPKKP